jgi:mono/diheme cytochrome c family protein
LEFLKMPRKRGGTSSSSGARGRGSSGPSGVVVLSFLLGAGAAAGGTYLYLHSAPQGSPAPIAAPARSDARTSSPRSNDQRPGNEAHPAAKPSADASTPAPRASLPTPPFGINEDVFEAGAHLYAARCAGCHGTTAHDAPSVASAAAAPQLLRTGRKSLAARKPGELFTEISAGAPERGMPAYRDLLTETQRWQIALLLNNAAGDLPDPVLGILGRAAARN